MEQSLAELFKFYEELNIAELLYDLWSFRDITSKYVFTDQSKKIISAALELLKKK